MSISLFIAQFVGSGITILFLYGFYVAGAGTLPNTLILVTNLALLACIVTSLGVVSNLLETWKRVLIATVLSLWCLTSILGFPFSPVSAFTGSLLYGSISMFILALIVVPVALRELAYIELGSLRTLLRTTSAEYKRTMSFAGKGPIRTIYSYHLSYLELVGRFNLGGSTSYRATRIKTRTVLIFSTIASIAYLVFIAFSSLGGILSAKTTLSPIMVVLPIFLGVITLTLMAQGTLSNERGWLAFAAMDPTTYLRHLLLSRVISTLAVIGPFGVADLVLALIGFERGIEAGIVLLLTIPTASILSTYIVARLGAVQQVKEEGMMPGQFDLRQFLVIIPIYLMIGLIIVSELFLIAAIAITVTLGVLAILLLASANTWRGIAYRLTERGFV